MRALSRGLPLVLLGLLAAAPAHARGGTGRAGALTSRGPNGQTPSATGITIPRGSWDARLQSAQSYLGSFRAARRALRGRGGLVELKRDLPTPPRPA